MAILAKLKEEYFKNDQQGGQKILFLLVKRTVLCRNSVKTKISENNKRRETNLKV